MGVIIMADSAITKRALANALKALVSDVPFSKISISDICGACEMNRKSFYYHFKDKYDLVNWIFDSEYADAKKSYGGETQTIRILCGYLYVNRDFYRRIFKIEGQNSFRSHFYEYILEYAASELADLDQGTASSSQKIYLQFIADGFVCAVERWMLDWDCMPPEQFSSLLYSTLERIKP